METYFKWPVQRDKNETTDLMFRMTGSEKLEGSYAVNTEYLPKGLMKEKESRGGDSIFESMLYGLHDLMNEGLVKRIPDSTEELRNKVMTEVCKG